MKLHMCTRLVLMNNLMYGLFRKSFFKHIIFPCKLEGRSIFAKKWQFFIHISASCASIALKLCTHLHLGTNYWFNKFRQGDRFIFSKTARQNVVFHDFLSFVNSTSCLNQALHPFRVFLQLFKTLRATRWRQTHVTAPAKTPANCR